MDSGLQVNNRSQKNLYYFNISNSKVSQQTSQTSGGNVIVLNNNDMMQQRTSLGGQQVIKQKQNLEKFLYLLNFRLFLKQVHHQHLIQHKVKFCKQLMDN
jgi:hypothetical protein